LFEFFQLKRQSSKLELLESWIKNEAGRLDDESEITLKQIEPFIESEIDGWFEEELKMNLLSPILILSRLKETEKIGVFF